MNITAPFGGRRETKTLLPKLPAGQSEIWYFMSHINCMWLGSTWEQFLARLIRPLNAPVVRLKCERCAAPLGFSTPFRSNVLRGHSSGVIDADGEERNRSRTAFEARKCLRNANVYTLVSAPSTKFRKLFIENRLPSEHTFLQVHPEVDFSWTLNTIASFTDTAKKHWQIAFITNFKRDPATLLKLLIACRT